MADIPFQASFSEEEFDLLGRGLIPETMDDKWFAYMEDDTLYLHRSWTGIGIYTVQFQRSSGAVHVTRAQVLQDSAAYRPESLDGEADQLKSLIRRLFFS